MKYVIIVFGFFILVGLVFIDETGNTLINSSSELSVLVVNGKSTSLEQFQKSVSVQQQQTDQKSVNDLKLLRLRKTTYDRIINGAVLEETIERYGLYASPAEMWNNLDNEPLPGADQDTTFQTNGEFDKEKYQRWLREPRVLNSQMMKNVEAQLKLEIIPQKQLLVYLASFTKPTYIEANFNHYSTRVNTEYHLYKIENDSVDFDSSLITDKNLKEFYNQNKGQFLFNEDAVKMSYVSAEVNHSSQDSLTTKETAQDVSGQLNAGANFKDMVNYYSDDESTLSKGGSLGDFRARGFYVPAFDKVAFSLKKDSISKPVLTRYGWHIIRCDDIKGRGSKKQIKVSHILLKIQVGIETLDSVKQFVDSIKQMLDENQSLVAFKKQYPKIFKEVKTLQFNRWEFSPISDEFVSGLHSFGFGDFDIGSFSNSLPNANSTAVYVFEKQKFFEVGDSFERAKDKVKEKFMTYKKQELAKQKLEKLLPKIKKQKIKKLVKKLGDANLTTTKSINTKSWDFEIGYDQVAMFAFLSTPIKKWSSVEIVKDGSIIAYPIKRDIEYSFLIYNEKNSSPEPFQTLELGFLSYNFNNDRQKNMKIVNHFDIALNN